MSIRYYLGQTVCVGLRPCIQVDGVLLHLIVESPNQNIDQQLVMLKFAKLRS